MAGELSAWLVDRGIAEIQDALAAGDFSSRELVQACLDRIAAHDGELRSVIELNPEALTIADRLDRDRRVGRLHGRLHGIPILLKDNIDTGDRMQTTAGSLALLGSSTAGDATAVRRLRRHGVIVLGKTNLSEWANFRSNASTSGWSARGGLTRNPWDLACSASGSSSGSAVAAAMGFAAGCLGTETDGSIVSPANVNGVVGLKPTVGLVSRAGVIPISWSQDSIGPMTRGVRDAAILLGALTGVDLADPVTAESRGKLKRDYERYLRPGGLHGLRIGVAREVYTGFDPPVDRLFEEALATLRDLGAAVVDPADIPTAREIREHWGSELTVLLYEFRRALEAYLATRRPGKDGREPPRTLAALVAFNREHAAEELAHFGQEIFERALEGPDDDTYRVALERNRRRSREDGIDAALAAYRLDLLVAPTGGPARPIAPGARDTSGGGCSSPPAMAGYPLISVPMGLVEGLPVGLSFIGTAWSEPVLLRVAAAYEAASQHWRPPPLSR